MVTFIIFGAVACVGGGVEIVCGVIDAAENQPTELLEVFRRVLLVIFCAMQAYLFCVNYRKSVQVKRSVAWFCGCHLVAMNISFWFFNVGLEVREIGLGCGNESHNSSSSYCEKYSLFKFTTLLYPFGIEYYVMGACIAYNLVDNTGRLAVLLHNTVTKVFSNQNRMEQRSRTDSSENLLGSQQNQVSKCKSEFDIIRLNPKSFSLGVVFVVFSCIATVFILTRKVGESDDTTKCILYSALILLYSSTFILTLMLWRSLNKDNGAQLSSSHITDRFLLWVVSIAIIINDFYNSWIAWTEIGSKTNFSRASSILLGVTCLLNMIQSLAQVFALEYALLRKLKDYKTGWALLNLLILLNAAQWIINSFCLTLFFPNKEKTLGLVLSLITIPLQVFFRFHSAACIQEFKRHCKTDESQTQDPPVAVNDAAGPSAAHSNA